MARSTRGQAERDEFLKELRKLMKAAMIIDIFLYDKNNKIETSVSVRPQFKFEIQLLHSASLHIKSNKSSSYSEDSINFLGKQQTTTRHITVAQGVSAIIIHKMFEDKPKGFIKRFDLEDLKFIQNSKTDEEISWARFVFKEANIDITSFHLDETKFELTFERESNILSRESNTETIWATSLEDAKRQQKEMLSKPNLGKPYTPGWYTRRTISQTPFVYMEGPIKERPY